MYQVNEQDWKLFRKKLPLWQETYMARLNQEYMQILSGSGSASDKFRELERRILRDRESPGVVVDMRRSKMWFNLVSLLLDEIIHEEDIVGFSEELSEALEYLVVPRKDFQVQK